MTFREGAKVRVIGKLGTVVGHTQRGWPIIEFEGGTLRSYSSSQLSPDLGALVTHERVSRELLMEVERLIEEVPDENDPDVINYWRFLSDKYIVYLEGWCDECLAGTGFPPMERGGTAGKIQYMEDLTPGILKEKAKERGLRLLQGGFKELEEADNLYGVTWGIYAWPKR